jgi:hypothetical protein
MQPVSGKGSAGESSMTDFSNRDERIRWLEAHSQEVAVAFAARAALRGVAALGRQRSEGDTALRVLRCVAASWALAAYPDQRPVLLRAARIAISSRSRRATNFSERAAINAVRTATTKNWVSSASKAVGYALKSAGAKGDRGFEIFLMNLAADAQQLDHGICPTTLVQSRLWKFHAPTLSPAQEESWSRGEDRIGIRRIADAWNDFASDLKGLGDHWRVWIEWYAHVADGLSLTEDWDRAFVELLGKLPWSDDAEAVNLAITARVDLIAARRVPDQSLAPIRIEERNGKIARALDRDSPLRVKETEFIAWRDTVLEHIQELLSNDFSEGTSHVRVRNRLTALEKFLTGGIEDVKERQFRIGNEIVRFDRLLSTYRPGTNDMDAAVWEDLDHLRIMLKMGIDKLERWGEFSRAAKLDSQHAGDADPQAVGALLEQIAIEMEGRPKYFDPELLSSFRFLAEAVKDPMEATKTVVYGAVKSIENLLSFLGQRALGIGRKATESLEISKGVATDLVIGFGAAALNLSESLPHGWGWLKPLLEALKRQR